MSFFALCALIAGDACPSFHHALFAERLATPWKDILNLSDFGALRGSVALLWGNLSPACPSVDAAPKAMRDDLLSLPFFGLTSASHTLLAWFHISLYFL